MAAINRIYKTLSKSEKHKFDSALKLLFAGDLILLEDSVKNAFDGEKYDFSSIFTYTSPYISQVDYSVGVFEGPCAGSGGGYSSSNYGDGKPLALNFPDSFAKAVKNAGFNLVTTANNHFLDKGVTGAMRTLDVLDSIGLDHIGTYRSKEEKEKVKIVELQGIKFAFLAYTPTAKRNLKGNDAYLSSFVVNPQNEQFAFAKEEVFRQFAKVKAENPDIIIVMPHMGGQFLHAPDDLQKAWYEVFSEAGADIVICCCSAN
ncbi:hypothetical protein FACS189418_3280 [Clostridia bacterium]|nr:hypothetical protein FACS189418_3280 [Clostridia bacterium]